MDTHTTYKYFVARSVLELDETLNSVASINNNYQLSLLQKNYNKIKEGKLTFINNHTTDTRSVEEMRINYAVGQALEGLTVHTLMRNKSFNGFVLNWEQFITLSDLIVYNSDTNSEIVRLIGAKNIKILEGVLEEFSGEVIEEGGLLLSNQLTNKLIEVYLRVIKSQKKIRKLELPYPQNDPPKVPDLLVLMRKKILLDQGGVLTNYAVPLEVIYTTNLVYKFRYDKNKNSKFDLLKNTLYLLYKIEPTFTQFKNDERFQIDEKNELKTYPIFKKEFQLLYYPTSTEEIRKKLKRKTHKQGDKYFDSYKHNTYYLKFHNDRELIAREFTAFLNLIINKKIENHFRDRGYEQVKILL